MKTLKITIPIKILILFATGCLIGWAGKHFHLPLLFTGIIAILYGWNFENILNLFKKDK